MPAAALAVCLVLTACGAAAPTGSTPTAQHLPSAAERPSSSDRPEASATARVDSGAAASGIPDDATPALVRSITDGDTIRVELDGTTEPVRLLAIDAPEAGGDCGAAEARAFIERTIPPGATVWLQSDTRDRDRFGRLLRYVYDDDGVMVNEALVASGRANAKLYGADDRHWELLQAAEDRAITGQAGIWGSCAPGFDDDGDAGAAPADPRGGSGGSGATSPDGRCDPNYSGCVPPYPPDVDCSSVDGPVAVLGDDPHNLDGNGDGQGCEPPP